MIISELLLHTRRVGRCITFHELGLYVNFDRLLVCEYLAKSINYKEANYENAINPYLYELGLNFKQACICKSFIKTMNELEYEFGTYTQILKITSALIMTLKMLKIPKETREVCALLKIQETNKIQEIESKMLQCKHKWIQPTNKWARQTLGKHVW